jgi:NAD(P)-dependent dehydrogenase (short-subunit alcohol dehydrogenase family)
MPECSPFSLRGKVIIQCGASGRLGPALVSALSAADATLVIASRNRALLEALAAEERVSGRIVEAESVDVTAEASIRMLRDRVLAKHQRIDGLVYNSVSRPMHAFGDDLSAWEASMKTNATGLFATTRTFGDVMANQRTGSIVNIASTQGMVGSNPYLYEGTDMTVPPDYFFHKGGMLNLTRALASHYGTRGVRVNAVSPGGIYNSEHPQAQEFLRRYGQMTMLGRLAEAREIGGAVVFLLSDAASYITGINLPVDGGYTAK